MADFEQDVEKPRSAATGSSAADGNGPPPFDETLPEDEFGAPLRESPAPTTPAEEPPKPATDEEDATRFGRRSFAATSRSEQDAHRYRVVERLGSGATGEVFAVYDNVLERLVAAKLLRDELTGKPGAVEKFIQEARTAAQLDHPNILPVYDIDRDESGTAYLSMKRICGRSLAELLQQEDRRLCADDAVSILLKVCDALAMAHSQGIIHQDVKPSNIMVGNYGEVYLVDWGSAASSDARTGSLVGTPAYMSPEQARREVTGPPSDVYGIGATLFHALIGRPPTALEPQETFWERKRQGRVDHATRSEALGVPKPLLAIAMKALSPQVENRYADATSVGRDLRAYQAGLAVGAYPDGVAQAICRWHRLHGKTFWSVTLLLLLAGLLVMTVYGQRLKEIARWGAPSFVERFDSEGWKERWVVYSGNWDSTNGHLRSSAGESVAFLDQMIVGPTAMEFDGWIEEDAPGGDVSAMWVPAISRDPQEQIVLNRERRIYFQVGCFDNTFSMIQERPARLDGDSFRLKKGQRYRIRAEVDGNSLRLFIDGRKICEYEGLFSYEGGYFGLYGYHPGKCFDNVRIYRLGVPEKQSVIALGDSYFSRSMYDCAIEEYEKILTSHESTPLAQQALYRMGLCRMMQNDRPAAFAIWRRLADPALQGRVETHRLQYLLEEGSWGECLQGLRTLAQQNHEVPQHLLSSLAGRLLEEAVVLGVSDPERLKLLRELSALFGDDANFGYLASRHLLWLGQPQSVLQNHPRQTYQCGEALIQMGRFDEFRQQYPDLISLIPTVLLLQNRLAELDQKAAYDPTRAAQALIFSGKATELADHEERQVRDLARLYLGRFSDVTESERHSLRALALLYLGRLDDALALSASEDVTFTSSTYYLPRLARVLDQHMQGRHEEAERLAAALAALPTHLDLWEEPFAFSRFILPAVLQKLRGEQNALADLEGRMQEMRHLFAQSLWHQYAYLTGQIAEEDFLAQPVQLFAPARLLFLKALRADLAGDRTAAIAEYNAYVAVPLDQKGLDAVRDRFVQWRLRDLQS